MASLFLFRQLLFQLRKLRQHIRVESRIFDLEGEDAAATAQPTSAEIFADLRRRNQANKAAADQVKPPGPTTGPGGNGVTKTLSDLSSLKALIKR